MAEIPVERKSNLSWLWWLLALIAIALLLWWLFADGDDEAELATADDDIEMVETDTTDLDTMGAGLAALAVGDTVDMDGLRVASVSGDMSFMASDGTEEMFVVFDQERTPATATEGEFDLNEGMMVNIDGRVMGADEPLPEGVDASIPSGADMYIFADSLEVAERSETPGTTN